MANMISGSKGTEDWKAREDARTLAEAYAIRADKPRHAKAKKHAKILLDERQKEADAMRMVHTGNAAEAMPMAMGKGAPMGMANGGKVCK
jgi:2-polyprenyl-6-methoxyphenol hydroxylase-like FAD-dependent oxidoreductase